MKGSAARKQDDATTDAWRGFKPGDWSRTINVRDFIVHNVTSYAGDEKFLAPASQRTKAVWGKLQPYFADERKKGVLAVEGYGLHLREIGRQHGFVRRRLDDADRMIGQSAGILALDGSL